MFRAARRRFLSLFCKTTAATAVVGVTGVAAASPTDDELRRLASVQLMTGTQLGDQPFGLKQIGLDWKEEQRQLIEEDKARAEIEAEILAEQQDKQRRDLNYLLELERRLLADSPTYFNKGIDIPFAMSPGGNCNLYLRTPTEAYDTDLYLEHLLDDLRDNFPKRVQEHAAMFFEHYLDHLYDGTKAPAGSPPVERVARLNKYQKAGRVWSPRYICDIDELTPAKVGAAIIGVVRSIITAEREKIDEAIARAPGRPVEYMKSAPLKVLVKIDGPMVEISGYVEMTGQIAKA